MDYKKRAKELVAQMTIAEKMSQMRYDAPAIPRLGIPAYNWWNDGTSRSGSLRRGNSIPTGNRYGGLL